MRLLLALIITTAALAQKPHVDRDTQGNLPSTRVTGTAAETMTFTNKTIDCEATGNVCVFPEMVKWAPPQCSGQLSVLGSGTPAAEGATGVCEGSNINKAYARFLDTGTYRLAFRMRLPDITGNADWGFFWKSSATAGNVVFQFRGICAANAEDPDPAYGATVTITDAAQGVAGTLNSASATGITLPSCASNEIFLGEIFRDPTHASDTLAATADLESFFITYRRTH